CAYAAAFFDLLEKSPCLLGERLGKRIDVTRSGGGVADMMKPSFLHQDDLRISRHAAGKFIRQARGEREGQGAETVRAAKPGSRGRGPASAHVRMRRRET